MMVSDELMTFLIGTLVTLVAVIVFFLLVDKLLKLEPKKTEPKKNVVKKEETPKIDKPAEKPNVPVMQIYNSELADDLNELLKNSEKKEDTRIKVESHVVESGNISKYVKEKKYQAFNFGDNESDTEAEEEPMTFTREDYKKFMALSNIDQPK